jgi:hypothetical protein
MIRLLAALLLAGSAALAQQAAEAPSVEVALAPDGAVTVGTPVAIRLTVLVPTYMPAPPVWPDLQVADAITRLPPRATQPVTRRIGAASWSGLTRSYEVIPQRAADFDLSGATIAISYADPDSNARREATLPVPPIAFAATIPAGAEALNPFVATAALTLVASVDGLPAAPKPGDAFTVTLTTTATGTPAMLLPPLAERLPVPEGLRAYPHEPALTDTPGERGAPATGARTDRLTYVIEAPGSYALPPVSLSWWNTASNAVDTAKTTPITFEVAPTAGQGAGPGSPSWRRLAVLAAGVALVGAAILAVRRRHGGTPRPPSERRLYHQLQRSVRRAPVAAIRPRLSAWLAAASPADPSPGARVERAILALERTAYGPAAAPEAAALRRSLLAALAERRTAAHLHTRAGASAALPPLNPTGLADPRQTGTAA